MIAERGGDLTPEQAQAAIAAWLGRDVGPVSLRRLTGGCVYTVLEATFCAPESPVVFKVAALPGDDGLVAEHFTLSYLHRHGLLRVPRPLACDVSGAQLPVSYLAMERLPGVNMGQAAGALSAGQREQLEREMGEAVARLHVHTGRGFGLLAEGASFASWADWFRGLLVEQFEENVGIGLLASAALAKVEQLIGKLPEILEEPPAPTLVHGDIWSANVMVDPNGGCLLSGFLDPAGVFADPEYELAYLELWRSVGPGFFRAYHAVHPRRPSYETRRQVYWLNTLLLHVWFFRQQQYVDGTERVLDGLSGAVGL